jgi:hypothetical protein
VGATTRISESFQLLVPLLSSAATIRLPRLPVHEATQHKQDLLVVCDEY